MGLRYMTEMDSTRHSKLLGGGLDEVRVEQVVAGNAPFLMPMSAEIAIILIVSALVAGGLCLFLWKCWCQKRESISANNRGKNPLYGTKQGDRVNFVLPTVQPGLYEETVQIDPLPSRLGSRRGSLAPISDVEEAGETGHHERKPSADYMSRRRSSLGLGPILTKRGSMSAFDIAPDELDMDMYSGFSSADEGHATPSMYGLGRLCFSLRYKEGVLTVELIRAVYLSTKSIKETADPYCKLLLLPEKKPKYVSKILRNTLNPIFSEQFSFPVAKEELKQKTLRVTVCDYDRFSRQVVLGYVTFPLQGVAHYTLVEGTDDVWRDICDDTASKAFRGELLFSLCHDPDKGCLSVAILKAKDLHTDTETDIGRFVKVSLLVAERVLKSKKTKTRQNGVYNEEFVLHIAPALMGQVSLVISVCSRNSFGLSTVLGKTNAGPFMYSSGQGLEHWNDMLASPKSAVAQWHNIY